ncbi:MAG: heterodisulfide reductase-related iron-sulfur binding cluster [Roseobacter sp.]
MKRFDEAFASITEETAAACVACGDCFKACPITEDAGLTGADDKAVVQGILDIIASGSGPDAAQRWANACVLSGDCVSACDYGVNPRLLLSMARMSVAQETTAIKDRRRAAVTAFKGLGRDVRVMSRLQLDDTDLSRLAPKVPVPAENARPSEVVFYTGCNVLKTPHIALLCLDILDLLEIDYVVQGGPSHCCGILQMRSGDIEAAGRMGSATLEKFAATEACEVLTWCPSCFVNFKESIIPAHEHAGGTSVPDMKPFILYLLERLEDLRPHLVHRVPIKVALHGHRGIKGVPEAARQLLAATPGVELVDLEMPDSGLMSNSFRALPEYRRNLHARELEAAADAGIDALAAVYHADHRELCAHERDWPFMIVNVLDVLGAGLGLTRDDTYKKIKIKQDVDAILQDCAAQIEHHSISVDEARSVLEDALFGDQPLELRGPI